jgi:hypothetical protein
LDRSECDLGYLASAASRMASWRSRLSKGVEEVEKESEMVVVKVVKVGEEEWDRIEEAEKEDKMLNYSMKVGKYIHSFIFTHSYLEPRICSDTLSTPRLLSSAPFWPHGNNRHS